VGKTFVGKKNPFYGKSHSKETKKILSEKCGKSGKDNGFYGKTHSKETRQKMSTIRIEKIKSGEIDVINNSRKGSYKGMRFDSFYELRRIMQLEQDENVEEFMRNKTHIEYEWSGTKKYLPDFLVLMNY